MTVNTFASMGIRSKTLSGDKFEKADIFDKEIEVTDYRIVESNYAKRNEDKMCLHLQFKYEGRLWVVFLGSEIMMDQIKQVPADKFPFKTKIIKELNWYKFT